MSFWKPQAINGEQFEAHKEAMRGKTDEELREILRVGRVQLVQMIRIAIEWQARAHLAEYHGGVDASAEEYLQLAEAAWGHVEDGFADRLSS